MSKHEKTERLAADAERIVEQVRTRYGRIAGEGHASCCGAVEPSQNAEIARSIGYDESMLGAVPEQSNLGLGCGAPIPFLALQPGETVLDLGSGAGFDAFIAARAVGPTGRVIGVDMTPEMIDKARSNAAEAGYTQVEFVQGRLEDLPLPAESVDAVTSNCVINLVPDKARVFREVARVLRPGGRLVVSDIVLDGRLPARIEQDLLAYVGCVAGAMQRAEYFEALRRAGLSGLEVLRDVDYLATVEMAVPQDLLARLDLETSQLEGIVHSVTFRAVR